MGKNEMGIKVEGCDFDGFVGSDDMKYEGGGT